MYFYLTFLIAFLADIITKYTAQIFLEKKLYIIKDFIFLKYIKNPWVAFWVNLPFLKILTLILISLIFYYYFKEEKKKNNNSLNISFWLILWWAVWNWIERIFFWEVTDFIWVSFFSIFNLADASIFIWAVIYFIYLFKIKE